MELKMTGEKMSSRKKRILKILRIITRITRIFMRMRMGMMTAKVKLFRLQLKTLLY